MSKYVIVGVTKNGKKQYVKDTKQITSSNCNFIWVDNHKDATKYTNYDFALLDWEHIIKYHSDTMKRIFIPIYDENIPPWNETT